MTITQGRRFEVQSTRQRPKRTTMSTTVGHILLALVVLLTPTARAETVWRYVGADGEIAYTTQPPKGVSAEAVTLPETFTDPTTNTPATGTDEPRRDRLTPAQQEALDGLLAAEVERAREAARLQAANCDRARGVLERLSTSGRVRVRDTEGQERAMTEAERQERIQQAAEVVAASCTPAPER